MRKIIIFTIMFLAVILSACSGGGEATTTEPSPIPPTELPVEPTLPPVGEENNQSTGMTTTDMEGLTAQPWQWVAFSGPIEQFDVEEPENYTLTFQDDGTVNILADCNNAIGSYTVEGSSLTIEVGPMTLAACPSGSLSDDFVKYLGFAAIHFFEEGDLFVDLMADGGTMRFSPFDGSMEASAPGSTEDDSEAETISGPTTLPENVLYDRGPMSHATGIYQEPYYTVAQGDTISSIAQRFGVEWQEIATANGVKDTLIYAGQTLLIPDESSGTKPSPPEQGPAERVNFQAGTTSNSLSGVINQGVPESYILGVRSGQVLTVQTESHGEPLVISIGNTRGDLLPITGVNSQIENTVSVTLPESGDFIVTIRPVTLPEGPQLAFDVTFTIP